MTYCKTCRAPVGDLGDPHQCPYGVTTPTMPFPNHNPLPPLFHVVKCDVCGSTAIDHTEAQCLLNRTLKAPKQGKE